MNFDQIASPATILQRGLRLPGRLVGTAASRAGTLMRRPILLQQAVYKRGRGYTLASHISDAQTQKTKPEKLTEHDTLSTALSLADTAASKLPRDQCFSEAFVESVGAVISRLGTKQIRVLH